MTAFAAQAKTGRQVVFSLILAASLITTLAYYVAATGRLVMLNRNASSLAIVAQQPIRPARGGSADIRALAANPLDQRTVNNVIVAQARASGNMDRAGRQAMLLRQLGWRSTSALQSLVWRAATANDQRLLMDTLDALLRREQLLGQIYPVLDLMTLDPMFRARLVRRLAARPSWRRYYFMSATNLEQAPDIEGRYLVMHEVQRTGDRLVRNEVAPVLPKLLQTGNGAQAFDLWRVHSGGMVSSPLADTNFVQAARPLAPDALPVPFEWQLGSGSGYFVDAGSDASGGFASIDWDGRGTPVLLGQTTSARRGRYRLDVTADISGKDLADRFGFRLVCPGGATTTFDPQQAGSGPHAVLATAGTTGCDFPTLEMFGLIQPDGRAATAVLRSVQLRRIG